MMNPFGNYLCQKLAEKCNNDQLSLIVEKIYPNIIKICTNIYGTRSIQKLYEIIREEKIITKLNILINTYIIKFANVFLIFFIIN